MAAGGIALGAALGFVGALLRRRLDAPQLEITVGLIIAYGSFALRRAAAPLRASSPSWPPASSSAARRRCFTPQARVQADGLLAALSFVAESTLFLLVGLAFADVAADAEEPRCAAVMLLPVAAARRAAAVDVHCAVRVARSTAARRRAAA